MRAEWRRLAGALIWVAVATAGCADLRELTASPEELRRQHEGILEARIVSALPIDDRQQAELVARLEAKHGRKVSAQVEVDPKLIGGVRIVIGDKVIDATVRGKLDAMAAALTH